MVSATPALDTAQDRRQYLHGGKKRTHCHRPISYQPQQPAAYSVHTYERKGSVLGTAFADLDPTCYLLAATCVCFPQQSLARSHTFPHTHAIHPLD